MNQGAVAASGRLEPALAAALAERRWPVYQSRHCTLLHSHDADLRHAVHRGDAFLTRLEGELCLRFQ
jgi:hypothetical protein